MAVTVHKIENYYSDGSKSYEFKGLSTDSKPEKMDGDDVGVNSLFLELDTGDFYYFDSEWVKIGESPAGK